jgi:hypothetical protein
MSVSPLIECIGAPCIVISAVIAFLMQSFRCSCHYVDKDN